MRTKITTALFMAFCLIMLNGNALPFYKMGAVNTVPDNDPTMISGCTYNYFFNLNYFEGHSAADVLPGAYSYNDWSVGEGMSCGMVSGFKNQWYSNPESKGKTPATPVVCIDMIEHYFIAQFYKVAPGTFGAIILGQDGYFHNVNASFAYALSSLAFKCYGLPIGDSEEKNADGLRYYTQKVKADPCMGGDGYTLHVFPFGMPTSLKGKMRLIDICGVPIYVFDE